jgi:hypothetical protein
MMVGLLPQFLGIGAVKAGTTWLHRNLYQHPELYLPPVKPVRYFDDFIERPIDFYSAIFAPGHDRVRGELSASYSVLPTGTIEYIRLLVPDIKLIFILREPKARAWSEAKMEFSVIRGLGTKAVSTDDYCDFIQSHKCLSRGDYRAILANWLSVFPRSQIFIGIFDDICERPAEFLVNVLNFLGVSSAIEQCKYPLREKVFEGLAIEMPDQCRRVLDAIYTREQVVQLTDLAGMNLAQRWDYE